MFFCWNEMQPKSQSGVEIAESLGFASNKITRSRPFVGKIPKTPPLFTLQTLREEVNLKLEQLQPVLHIAELEKRLKDLRYVFHLIKRKNENAPSGHLKIAVKKNRVEYYYIKDRGSSRGSYIPKADISFAAQLAQKDYNHKLLPLLTKEIRCLESFLKATSSLTELQNLYQSFCPARRELIKPLTLTDDQYASQWQNTTWQGKDFPELSPNFFTLKNERVRSKSEVIIANCLFNYGVPYRYEFPLKLKSENGQLTIYPDFLCLNVRTREEIYWEHFGMLDNPEYAQKAVSKISLYARNGIFSGRGLILSMESSTEALNTKDIEKYIQCFLK